MPRNSICSVWNDSWTLRVKNSVEELRGSAALQARVRTTKDRAFAPGFSSRRHAGGGAHTTLTRAHSQNPGADGTFPRFPRKQYQKPVKVPSVPIFFPVFFPMPRNYLGSEYVPSQAKLVEPSGFPVALQVPLAFIPLNFPVPLVACHLFVPDCILPSATAPVNW